MLVSLNKKNMQKFEKEKINNIKAMGRDGALRKKAIGWLRDTAKYKYTYNFTWLGRPIIQFPQDIMAMQEIIWKVKPDLIIETGIAHGGSLIFYASILELIGYGEVLGIDIDIKGRNRKEIEKNPMHKRVIMLDGSSTSEEIVNKVNKIIQDKKKILVVLDSNHSHEHVLSELKIYSNFVSKGSYLVVFDTAIEDMPDKFYKDRNWGRGNNPRTAVREFLKTNNKFAIDYRIGDKLLISVSPDGYLKRIK